MAAALKPFGWTCTDEFWQRYYTDPWVFNLANAVERLTQRVAELERGEVWRNVPGVSVRAPVMEKGQRLSRD